jgi:hypothetical protein
VERFDQAIAVLGGERDVHPTELGRLMLAEATGARPTLLGELLAGDEQPLRAAFRQWNAHTAPARQIVGAEEEP